MAPGTSARPTCNVDDLMTRRTILRSVAAALAVVALAACSSGATAVSSGSSGSSGSSDASADGLGSIGSGLDGTTGLAATVYATGLAHASALTFDAAGRLWVATADYADSGADGVYMVAAPGATPVAVLPGVHTPLGLLWVDDALYVSGTGGVERYTGFDGAAFAAHSTVVPIDASVGELNGMALSPAGRIWLGISAPCDHCAPTDPYSAAVLSFLPDGSDVVVEASGIRAPIGLAYKPGTSDLYVTMNQRDDLGDATPGDWLGLVASGQDWGFPDCYGQGGAACAGVPSPVATLDAHAALSGVAIVGGSAIVAEWATGKVMRVDLATGTTSTLVTGIKQPEPVVATADGGVLVGDWSTGTMFAIAGL